MFGMKRSTHFSRHRETENLRLSKFASKFHSYFCVGGRIKLWSVKKATWWVMDSFQNAAEEIN